MKRAIKWLLRCLLYARLGLLPLSESAALHWVDVMKRWPALFGASPFRRKRQCANGVMLNLGLIDVVERSLFLTGTWDETILTVMESELKAGQTFVDVGANIGFFTLQASRLVGPGGKVLAIEPSHVNLARLADHAWSNRAENVIIASVAAGSSHGVPTLNFPTFNNAGAASLRPGKSVQRNLVLQWPLDLVFQAHGIRPDMIKLDIEGFELEALRGMRETLTRFAPIVVCEVTDQFLRELGQNARQLVGFMQELGYDCARLREQGQPPEQISGEMEADFAEQIDVVFRKKQDKSTGAGSSAPELRTQQEIQPIP